MWEKRNLIVFVVFFSAACATGIAFGEPQKRASRSARFWERREVKEKLELTPEQESELKARFYEAERSRLTKRSQIQMLELELRQLMSAGTTDEEVIQTKAREIGELKSQQYQDRIGERLSLKKILTPEQQIKLRELLEAAHRDARRNRTDGPRRARTPHLPKELEGRSKL